MTEVTIPVKDGTAAGVKALLSWSSAEILAGETEQIFAEFQIPEYLQAPVSEGAVIGNVTICLEDEPVLYLPVILKEAAEGISLKYCVEHIFAGFFDISDKV